MKLTRRQIQVLEMTAQGFMIKQIAERLHRSISVVEAHRANAVQRLGAKTLTHAVALALVHGIIDRSVITLENHDST